MTDRHPRDKFLTVYGRKPLLEVLENMDIEIDKVLMARKAKGETITEILDACRERGIEVTRESPEQVSRLSKNPKQDQGVAADVVTPHIDDAIRYLAQLTKKNVKLLALDGITTPANVGMIIRTATALGMDGIILPRKGSSKLNSLVIKASAGVVFKSTILKSETLTPVLKAAKEHDFAIYALSGEQGRNIYQEDFKKRSIFVLGNETEGVSQATESLVDKHLTIPMAAGVESLNVACAATVVAAEVSKRRL